MAIINVYPTDNTFRVELGENTAAAAASASKAEDAATIAQAITGPLYANTTLGLAATSDNDEFAVDNDDKTFTVYVNDAGSAVERRGPLPLDSSESGTSGLIGHASDETGAVARTIQAKLREVVSPEDFSGTDTARIQKALDTGLPVRCSNSAYAINGSLTPSADGQILDLNGALLTCTGSFDVFDVSGLQGVIIGNGRIEGAAMTGGDVFNLSDVERITLQNLLVFNPFNFAFVEEANVVSMNDVWVNNIRGSYGIRWLGSAAKRSDVLRLIGVTLSFPVGSDAIGIDWDGNCHTLQTLGSIIVNPGTGVKTSNTAGDSNPEFGFFSGLEIDFAKNHGVDLRAGQNFQFGPSFYSQGSVNGAGVFVASAIAANTVVFSGGIITNNDTYGIENNVRVCVANTFMSGNTNGNFLSEDDAVLTSPRFEVDANFLFKQDGSGNPILQFDANDSVAFNRAANDFFVQIGGTNRFQVSADNNAVRLMVEGALRQIFAGAADSGGTGFRMLRVPN